MCRSLVYLLRQLLFSCINEQLCRIWSGTYIMYLGFIYLDLSISQWREIFVFTKTFSWYYFWFYYYAFSWSFCLHYYEVFLIFLFLKNRYFFLLRGFFSSSFWFYYFGVSLCMSTLPLTTRHLLIAKHRILNLKN